MKIRLTFTGRYGSTFSDVFSDLSEMADYLANDFRGGMGLDEETIQIFLKLRHLDNAGDWNLDWEEYDA